MTTIFGLARLTASDYQFYRNADQQLLYTAAQQYIAMANDATMQAASAFVEPDMTEKGKERYLLGMTGRMQETGENSTGSPVARSGSWDVAYPLKNYTDSLAVGDVDMAYMTPADLQVHVDGIITRSKNAKRHAILKRLFNNTQETFIDARLGTLTVEPLADGDAVLFPPIEGSDSEATENHYLESGYASSSISDTNNPYATLTTELVEHGVNTTEDIPLAFLINSAEQSKTEALTNFVPFIPRQIAPGQDTDMVLMPSRPIPGKIIGYIRGMGWVSVWNWIPSAYIAGVNLAAPQALRMRKDIAGTNLGDGGLQLLPEERTGVVTFKSWRLRFGVGAANRLNAAIMELGTGGTYTIPTAYQ
jgi:hypothetical protein